jgi:ribosome-associated protein
VPETRSETGTAWKSGSLSNKELVTIDSSERATAAVTKLLAVIESSLDADKAEDIVAVDLAGKTSIADYMVIASGRSQRHVGAMAEHLLDRLKRETGSSARVEGMPQCDWVLIDAGDILVHLFRPEVRSFYNLEKLWSVRLPPAEQAAV